MHILSKPPPCPRCCPRVCCIPPPPQITRPGSGVYCRQKHTPLPPRRRRGDAIVRAPLDFPIMPPPAASTCSGSSIGSFVACSSFALAASSPGCSSNMSSPGPVRYEPHRHRHAPVRSLATQSQPSYAGSTVHCVPCRLSFRCLAIPPQSTTAVRARGEVGNFFASSPARGYYTSTCGAPLPQCRDTIACSLESSVYRPWSAAGCARAQAHTLLATSLVNATTCSWPQFSAINTSSACHSSMCLLFLHHHARDRTVTS